MEDQEGSKGKDRSQASRVCVAVRCRPLNEREVAAGGGAAVQIPDGAQLLLRHKHEDHPYTFDHVFGPEVPQEHIFGTLGVPQLDQAFEGYNSTIFAYGQTGSGKTHTMMSHRAKEQERGLIPRISEGLFKRIAQLTGRHETRRFLVQCSFLEIYNEVIYDLLAPKRKEAKGGGLEVKEQKGIGVYVKDLTETVVEDAERLARLIEEGMAHRATAATKMNDASSRSHCVFTIRLHQKDLADSSQNTISKLNLVDLAGSERAKDTGAEGALLKEGANINKSLSALGNVINALSSMAETGKRKAFVPYRDSKLTRVLQESLGGNAFCTMVAAVSPAAVNAEETLSTLNYARRAKTIRVAATRNEESSQILQLEREVEALRQKLSLENEGESRETNEVEDRHRQELETLQKFMKQSWEDKQKLSEEYEERRAAAKQEAERVADQLRGERRRRLQLLEQHGDLPLSLQAVQATGSRLCAGWPDKISAALKAWRQLQSQLRAVALYRESAGADLAALWGRCTTAASGEGFFDDAEVAPAVTLLGQVRVKLESMSGELDALVLQEAQVKEQLGEIEPEVAIALCDARAEAAAAVAARQEERPSEEDTAKEELPELLALMQRQLRRHCAQEDARLEAEAQGLFLQADLHRLAQCLDREAPGALPAELQAEAEAEEAAAAAAPGAAEEAEELPRLLGISTGELPSDRLCASSNAGAAGCARLRRAAGFAGWSPARDSAEEFLEVDLGAAASTAAVVGLSLQGREPCTGHWAQTHELLRLALASSPHKEEHAFLHVADKTFARPPVRLVHEASVALVHSGGCFGGGNGGWQVRSELLTYSAMTREHKIEFFDELIKRANRAWEKDGSGAEGALANVTTSDILGGKKCEETNKLLQMLSYLCLGLPGAGGGEAGAGGLCDAAPQWATAWTLEYLAAGPQRAWRWYAAASPEGAGSQGEALVLEGNMDAQSVKFVGLPRPLVASRLRLHPAAWHRHPGVRCEVHLARAPAAGGGGSSGSGRLRAGVGLAAKAVLELQGCLEERQCALSRREDDLKEQAAQERGDLERRLQEALARAEASEARAVAAEAALLHARADNERLGAAGTQLEVDKAAASEARASAEARAAEREKECEVLRADVDDLREQLMVMTDARDVLRRHEEDLAEAIATKDEELFNAHRSWVDLTQQLEEKELEGETADLLANAMSGLNQQLVEYQEARDNAVRECGRLRNEVSRLEAANQAITAERDKLARKREKLEFKKAELVDKLQASEKARLAAREKCMGMLEKRGGNSENGVLLKAMADGESGSPNSIDRAVSRGSGGGQSARSGGNYSEHSGGREAADAANGHPLAKSPTFGNEFLTTPDMRRPPGTSSSTSSRPPLMDASSTGGFSPSVETRGLRSPAFGGFAGGGDGWGSPEAGSMTPAAPATPAKRSKVPILPRDASAPTLRRLVVNR